jgi:hypothetical protein
MKLLAALVADRGGGWSRTRRLSLALLGGMRLIGNNSLNCLAAVPALSLAPLVGLLVSLCSAAPASPALAGAAAGLLAAASGATLYAFHCFDDSPLFVFTWYSLATGIVVLVGWQAGLRLLRW